ncbi:MAG TPA: hypothetical protein VMP86_05095 [Candidatus Binatia bacterium]|nr:hypothetical protein [Candidatus Binatia bacterium]
MLNSNHPDDERLSALASGDPDATADASLAGHVSTCDRCADLVNELGALRAVLADLPDLQPSRPLRLLPAAADAPARADRLGGWVRRFFAPALGAGAALAMVGLVGTSAPGLVGMAQSGAGQGDSAPSILVSSAGADPAASAVGAPAVGGDASSERAAEDGESSLEADESPEADALGADDREPSAYGGSDESLDDLAQVPAERSPWPMVLFTGLALMAAAVLLRWIVVPRAG